MTPKPRCTRSRGALRAGPPGPRLHGDAGAAGGAGGRGGGRGGWGDGDGMSWQALWDITQDHTGVCWTFFWKEQNLVIDVLLHAFFSLGGVFLAD